MKKRFYLSRSIIFILVFFICIFINNEAKAYDYYTLGDVSRDGKVTAADAKLVLRYAARLETGNYIQRTLADIDSDNLVTAKDGQLILKIASKQMNQPKTSNAKRFSIAAYKLHKKMEQKKYTYSDAMPNLVTEIEESKKVCCASYVAWAINELGGTYSYEMQNTTDGFNCRSCPSLKNKLDRMCNNINSGKSGKLVYKVVEKGRPSEVLSMLKPGDIVFFGNMEHVQIFAEQVGNSYLWFNAGNDKYIQEPYTNCVSYGSNYRLTVYRING